MLMVKDVSGAFRWDGAGGGVAPRERVHVSVSAHGGGSAVRRGGEPEYGRDVVYDDSEPVTAAGVVAIVREILAGMEFYILESDIAAAGEAVNDVAEQTCF